MKIEEIFPCREDVRQFVVEFVKETQERKNFYPDSELGDELLELTIGVTPGKVNFGWQTGDNSYTGGAYGHPYWSHVCILPDSDPTEIADLVLDDLEELFAMAFDDIEWE